MRILVFLSLVYWLTTSQLLVAAGPSEHKFTAKDQIKFAPETNLAFDHSGAQVTHSTLANGTQVAEFNGSMGNVTVARLAADGSIETFCTTDASAARAWMAGEDGSPLSKTQTAEIVVKTQ